MARWKKTDLNQADQFKKKREAVVREAGRAFAKRGFHNTSLDDVASALDVTKAALYTYIKTKQEILFECHKASMDLGDVALDEALATGGDVATIVRTFLVKYVRDLTSENGTFAVLTELDALASKERAIIVDRRDGFEKRLVSLLNRGIKEGSIAELDVKVAVFALMGSVHWVARWFNPEGRLSSEEMARRLSDILMRGIVERPGS